MSNAFEFPRADSDIWRQVMADTIRHTLDQMTLRVFMGDGLGNNNATSSLDLPAEAIGYDVGQGSDFSTIRPGIVLKKEVVIERELPASELTIEGKAKRVD